MIYRKYENRIGFPTDKGYVGVISINGVSQLFATEEEYNEFLREKEANGETEIPEVTTYGEEG